MATIVKRPSRKGGHTYQVQIRRKGHSPLFKSFDTKRDAQEWGREHDRETKLADAFTDARGRGKTLAHLLDRYIAEDDRAGVSMPKNLAWWRQNLGAKKLSEITPDVIADALDDLRAGYAKQGIRGGARSTGRKRKESTVNRYHAALSAVFRFALKKRWGWVKRNPCRDVERGQEGPGRIRYLSNDERERLLAACRNSEWPGLYPLVMLALGTGARRGELLNLKWSDVDLNSGRAILHRTKNGEPRTLHLVKPVREVLAEYAKVRRIDSELLFPAVKSPSKPLDFFYKYFNAAKAEAEIEDFRFHDCRHSCASYLAMNGASAVEIADVLGHKTLQMVQRYAHLNDSHKAALLERVTGRILG